MLTLHLHCYTASQASPSDSRTLQGRAAGQACVWRGTRSCTNKTQTVEKGVWRCPSFWPRRYSATRRRTRAPARPGCAVTPTGSVKGTFVTKQPPPQPRSFQSLAPFSDHLPRVVLAHIPRVVPSSQGGAEGRCAEPLLLFHQLDHGGSTCVGLIKAHPVKVGGG